MRGARLVTGAALLLTVGACADNGPQGGSSPSSSVVASDGAATPSALSTAAAMAPAPARHCGDPTAHVYHPYRLQLLDRCRTVSGVIAAIRSEPDGDYHVLLQVDPPFASMLRPANTTGEHGDLVLEPICQHEVTQSDAIAPCGGGVPLIPIPPIGTHVSATGTYVLDNDHGGWAELHPLFEIHAG
ncbi:MAG TPA: hypothetical protein VIN56_09595 [Candidatus Dormibacteraeota bacterium]